MTSMRVLRWGVMLVCLYGAQAQHSTGSSESALLDIENRWVAALVKADLVALDTLLVNSYVDTDEEGRRSDKRAVLAVLKSGNLKMGSIKLSNMRVFLYGNFAVVTGTAAQAGTFQGQPLEPTIVFTDSFILQNGKWQAVASQRTAANGG
jgi:Domain of unknown function (DUF4440)